MYISMNWIKDYIDLSGLDDEELINKFTLSTAEVEGITKYGRDTNGVVIGKVISVEPVKDSKKLHKVQIDVGSKTIQSICGAPNIVPKQTIAFAPQGSTVCGTKITESKLAGETSNGVCLSAKELGISDEHSGIMILDDSYKAGTDIKEIIPIDDTVFEIDNKSLTNRPDLWGHYGIAREFAAITGRKLKQLEVVSLDEYSKLPKVQVKVESDKCYRYSAIAVENISKKLSTLEMSTRLFYCGSRPINLLADITNYIMMELGQPMHAFDKSLVSNITVKILNNEQDFETLDGISRHIDKDTLMICNGNTPVAIAGIMGGKNTEITDNTNSLLLESATFDTVSIRKSSTRLGLKTDASSRYEKTLDPELTTLAIARYIKLLKSVDENVTVTSSITDIYNKKYDVVTIEIDEKYISRHIGQKIDSGMIENILKALSFDVTRNKDNFKIVVPSYRATKDISNKADIVEEIARIYGYDKITPKTTLSPLVPVKEDDAHSLEYDVKKLLAEKYGMSEVHSYIWFDAKLNKELGISTHDNIKIINSMNGEDSTLRYSMIPTLINTAYSNLKNLPTCNIFEIGRVFDYEGSNKPVEEKKVLGMVLADANLTDTTLAFKLKEIINTICHTNKNIELEYVQNTSIKENWIHPVNSFVIKYINKELGYISILHPTIKNKVSKKTNISIAQLSFDKLSEIAKVDRIYKKFTKYQTVDIDLSLTVTDTMLYSNIEKIIKNTKLDYLLNYKLIDIYEDKLKLDDKKNITIRFTLGSFDSTLTSEQINETIDKLITTFENNGIIIRK